jgi:hypothetical protein
MAAVCENFHGVWSEFNPPMDSTRSKGFRL